MTGSTEQIEAAKAKLQEIISRGQVKVEANDFNGHPAPSANELMNQNVSATAALEGNVMVSSERENGCTKQYLALLIGSAPVLNFFG